MRVMGLLACALVACREPARGHDVRPFVPRDTYYTNTRTPGGADATEVARELESTSGESSLVWVDADTPMSYLGHAGPFPQFRVLAGPFEGQELS